MEKVGLISLGCSRNLIDSEIILGSLKNAGFAIVKDAGACDICIINTCSFIDEARSEAIETILEASRLKKDGRIKRLVICGCLSQLYREKLLKELPEVDLVVGTSDYTNLPELLKKKRKRQRLISVSSRIDYLYDEDEPRILLTPRHYAYVKISEGCSNLCSYCIIPRLRGKFRSRPIESVVNEIEVLSKDGVLKEVDLIGQDTTLFGIDRYGRLMFDQLLKRLCALSNSVEWMRIFYTHPAHYTDELISVIKGEEKICKYLDLPVQHISDKVLKAMNRHTSKKEITDLIERLRKAIPGIVLRTSIIVGFPQETDKDFNELLDFLRETKFEHLGAFIYSKERGTKASRLKGEISEDLKRERFNRLMELQKNISSELNRRDLGKRIRVLVDEEAEGGDKTFIGRSQGDAPEVDGVVYVFPSSANASAGPRQARRAPGGAGRALKVGQFYDVKVTDTLDYDLIGEKA